MQIRVALRQRGWSGRTRDMSRVRFLSIPLIFCFILRLAPSPHQWSDFDNLYVIWRISAQESAFWESRLHCYPFRGSNFPKTPIWGV